MASNRRIPERRTSKQERTKIRVDVKINILHTIANAIYATVAGKVREAVANSRDNDATWVVIVLDQTNRRLSILDNGCGISRQRFMEIFDSIGYGFLGETDGNKLSYFGLGLMSVFQLGSHVKVYTRPRDSREILLLEIDSGAIFDKSNRNRSITDLSSFIAPLQAATERDRQRASLDDVNDIFRASEPVPMPSSFTEIIIEDIPKADVEEMGSAEFRIELRQLLPLRPMDHGKDTEPFLDRFTGHKRAKIIELFKNPDYCKTVDVYFGVQEELEAPQAIPQLWKYFPRFSSKITFPDDNVYVGISEDREFAFYAVHTIGEDLQRDEESEERETGFSIRNQNFLVKSADFLDKPGPGRKPAGTIDKPLRNWVFGEVFHRKMNDFLTVSRNDFLYEDQRFVVFRNCFLQTVAIPVNKAIRAMWDKRKPVMDSFVLPFANIADNDGPIVKAQERLRMMLGAEKPERQFYSEVKKYLGQRRTQVIENESLRVDTILSKKRQPLVLAEDENAVVRIVPAPPKSAATHEVRWDADSQKVVVNVFPSLFAPRNVIFLGDTYQILFVARRDSDAGVSIDVERKRIFVNPFNGDLSLFSVTILDVYIALEVADALSQNKGELKRNFLRLLGAAPSDAGDYVGPLGDDMRRSTAYAT